MGWGQSQTVERHAIRRSGWTHATRIDHRRARQQAVGAGRIPNWFWKFCRLLSPFLFLVDNVRTWPSFYTHRPSTTSIFTQYNMYMHRKREIENGGLNFPAANLSMLWSNLSGAVTYCHIADGIWTGWSSFFFNCMPKQIGNHFPCWLARPSAPVRGRHHHRIYTQVNGNGNEEKMNQDQYIHIRGLFFFFFSYSGQRKAGRD